MVRERPQSQRLGFGERFFARIAINFDLGNTRETSPPSTIAFRQLDFQSYSNHLLVHWVCGLPATPWEQIAYRRLMLELWQQLRLIASAMPLTVTAAVVAYTAAAAAIVSGRVRRWFEVHLLMPTPSSQSHVGALDAFRGLAAAWVALFHSWQWWQVGSGQNLPTSLFVEAGNKAVPVFVVLSGFLIYRAVRGIDSVDGLRRYYWNRILRIGPLCLASAVAVIVAGQLGRTAPPAGHAIAEVFVFRSLGYPVFANPPLWSLYVEIVFYVLAPLFIIASARQALIAAAIGFLVFSMSDAVGPREFELWKYFCVGVLASEVQRVWCGRVKEWQALALAAGGILWFMADIAATGWLEIHVREANPYIWPGGRVTSYTVDLALATGLIVCGATLSQYVRRMTDWMPLRILGAISFSLYVWHSMLILAEGPLAFDGAGSIIPRATGGLAPPEWFRIFVMLPAFVAVAALSFALIERPFLLRRRRSPAPPAGVVSV